MSNTAEDVLSSFVDKKRANSPFFQLKDGESGKVVKYLGVKAGVKAPYGGGSEPVDTLLYSFEVETPFGVLPKTFDNASQKFAIEMKEKGVKVGASFTISRSGQGAKTKYTIANLVNPA